MTHEANESGPPLVTVTIAAYNAGAFVAEAIDSALAQDYRPLEILVCDDGSTDDTARITGGYGEPVKLIRHGKNRGLGVTRNTLLRHATGKYMAILDADDFWFPRKVRLQVAAMEANRDAGLCHTGAENFGADSGDGPIVAAIRERIQGRCFATLLERNGVVASSALARRSMLPAHGFYEDLRGTEDYAMWLHITARHAAVYLDETLTRVRRHSQQMTAGIARMQVFGSIAKLRALSDAEHGLDPRETAAMRETILDELQKQAYSRYWNRDWRTASLGFKVLARDGRRVPWKHRLWSLLRRTIGS